MEKETVSITLNGIIQNDNSIWFDWYEESKKIFGFLGYTFTHVGIESSSLKSGKVLSVKRCEKKVINSIQNGDDIEYISLYSLSDDFNSASFDYNVLIARDYGYLTVIMNKSDYNDEKKRYILEILKRYINADSYEVYEMNRSECPILYAAKDNPPDAFSSLNAIESVKLND